MDHIPVIDVEDIGLHKNNDEISLEGLRNTANAFKTAFTQTGFLYLKNHGIPQEKLDIATKVTGDFFGLPPDVKAKYAVHSESLSHGYVGPNKELLNEDSVQELRESYNIRLFDGAFPDEEIPNMRHHVGSVAKDFEQLVIRILKVLSLALGLDDPDFLVEIHQGMLTQTCETVIRFLNYPVVEDKAGKGVVKLGEHADYGSFTLLFQDDAGGLEVRSVNNSWVEATPIPGTLLFNVAEMLEIWSAGRFQATKHRVFIPENKQNDKPRRSLAFFVAPGKDVVIKPLDGSTKLKPVVCWDHLQRRFLESYVHMEK